MGGVTGMHCLDTSSSATLSNQKKTSVVHPVGDPVT